MKSFERDMSTLLADKEHVVNSYATNLNEVEFSEEDGFKDAHGTLAGVGDTVYGTFDIPVRIPMVVFDGQGSVTRDTSLQSMMFIDGHFVGGVDGAGDFQRPYSDTFDGEDPLTSFGYSIDRKSQIRDRGLNPVQNIDAGYITQNVLYPDTSLHPLAARVLSNYAINRQNLAEDGYIGSYQTADARLTAIQLTPKYTFEADGARFGVSDVSQKGDHPWAVLHANPEGRKLSELMKPTFYYQSGSHAVWRALLAQTEDWHAKGMGNSENSADAALSLQKKFAALLDNPLPDHLKHRPSLAQHVVETVYGGEDRTENNARAIAIASLAMEAAGVYINTGGFFFRKQASPIVTPLHDNYGMKNDAPLFYDAYKPNFSNVLDSWGTNTTQYGPVNVKIVPSVNGEVNYAVYEHETDGGTQRWIGTAQTVKAPITKLGIPAIWPGLSDELIKPPIDYNVERTGYAPLRTHKTRFDTFANRSIAARRALGQIAR